MLYGPTAFDEVCRMITECPFRHYITHDVTSSNVYYEDSVSGEKNRTVYSGVHIQIATREFRRGEEFYIAFDELASRDATNRYIVSGKTLE